MKIGLYTGYNELNLNIGFLIEKNEKRAILSEFSQDMTIYLKLSIQFWSV